MMSCSRFVKAEPAPFAPSLEVPKANQLLSLPTAGFSTDFESSVARHLDGLKKVLIREHERFVVQGNREPPKVQEMMHALHAENEQLRAHAVIAHHNPNHRSPHPPRPPMESVFQPKDGVQVFSVNGATEQVFNVNGEENGEPLPGKQLSSESLNGGVDTYRSGTMSLQVGGSITETCRSFNANGAPEEAAEIPRVCECGNPFKDDAAFCRKCGKQREGICTCGNILAVDALFCRKCGRKQVSGGDSNGEEEENEKHELWETWTQQHKNVKERHLTAHQQEVLKGNKTQEDQVKKLREAGDGYKFVVHPDSKRYLVWQLLFTVVLSYELIMFPMGTFEIPVVPGGFLESMALFCVIFWTCDLILTFFTGIYTHDGDMVLEHRAILCHYVKSWLLPDVAVVLVDWIEVAGPSDAKGGSMKFAKMLRYLRMFRLLRLLRLRKLREAAHQMDEFINSVYFSIIKTLILNMIGIVVISHFLGCLWFMVGKMSFPGYRSWVERYEFDQRHWTYSYLTSLHWAICQFTPGGMAVQPQNNAERIFGISMLVLGMIIFSSIVSNIQRATTDLKNITARYDRQLGTMRRFCHQHTISKELLHKVCTYADNVIKPKMRGIQLHEVEMMRSLPKPLHMEMIGELYDQFLEVHLLFQTLKMLNVIVMEKLCFELKSIALSVAAGLFTPGESAFAMFFVLGGQLSYTCGGISQVLERGNYAVEVVMWTPWVYHGKLSSMELECDLISITASAFQSVLTQHPGTIWLPKKYATEFCNVLNTMEDSGEPITDLVAVESALEICKTA